ncbi:hypothetical protein [Cedecea sp. P7760]|uniref:hypothetical protein n=1 Tax=Cedecea sp. P7760 TaxID=2726983 RepID=UPI0015A4836B|nr:hypothetical protein [Cedecea sp. P7760]NWC65164.1 hypothetical protein [Cedecea sp. P7760]
MVKESSEVIFVQVGYHLESSVSFIEQIGKYSWCITLVGVCIALFGWRVAYKNSIRLATRSESKSIIDSVSKLVIEISDISIDFWLNKSTPIADSGDIEVQKKEQSIKTNQSSSYLFNVLAKAQQVSKLSDVLALRGLSIPDNLLSTVLEKTTLDCETAYQLDSEVRTVRSQEIVSACMQVIHALYETFQFYHPPAKQETLWQTIVRKYYEIDGWHAAIK